MLSYKRSRQPLLLAALLLAAASCKSSDTDNPVSADVEYSEARTVCSGRNALRNVYFGDLHFHTRNSWDAYGYQLRVTPDESYAFAKGGSVWLPPLDASGKGTREVRLERPLDFAGISDHSEYLGEVRICDTPGLDGHDSVSCQKFREGGTTAVTDWGMRLVPFENTRLEDLCGADGLRCRKVAQQVWQELQQSAEKNYDKTSHCGFTTFVGYEYTSSQQVSNMHRNVFFRNARVPDEPVTYYEAPGPWSLWTQLDAACKAVEGCEVMVIPHNSNWSNGRLYAPSQNKLFTEGHDKVPEADVLALRRRLEPVLEMFQHKGDMECQNGLKGRTDETECAFEKLRQAPVADCGESVGWGGIKDWGCLSKYDFVRGIFAEGLRRPEGKDNPYRPALIGSSDSHNGTPGNTWEKDFPGHVGTSDDTPEKRLSEGNMTHRGRVNNPGGLAVVWAVENSRDAIWEALQRRESYATSGTRIKLRLFGSLRGYVPELCQQDANVALETAYKRGVPMGGVLAGPSQASKASTAPTFWLWAEWDAGTPKHPGTRLQVAQIVKGWLDAEGKPQEKVFDVAGDRQNGAQADEQSCQLSGPGEKSLCAVWTDPAYQAGQRAFYYARVLENPTCRWSTHECNALPVDQRPEGCADPAIAKTVQERAWSSPIWLDPR